MEEVSTYSERIIQSNSAFQVSVDIYRAAVDFFIKVADTEWPALSTLQSDKARLTSVETITVISKERQVVLYPFEKADHRFYKMPCYLRRAAINEAIGKVSSRKRLSEACGGQDQEGTTAWVL